MFSVLILALWDQPRTETLQLWAAIPTSDPAAFITQTAQGAFFNPKRARDQILLYNMGSMWIIERSFHKSASKREGQLVLMAAKQTSTK